MQKQSESETLAMREKIYMTVQESVIGAGTGNYNKLKNIPVVNLRGDSADNCVILSGLNPGTFNLSGYYKIVDDGEVFNQEFPVELHSLVEEGASSLSDPNSPSKRVIYYTHYKNDNLYIRLIVYVGDEVETDMDICLTRPLLYWEDESDNKSSTNDDQNQPSDNQGNDQNNDDQNNAGGDDNQGQNDQGNNTGDNSGGDSNGDQNGGQDDNLNNNNNSGNGQEGGD